MPSTLTKIVQIRFFSRFWNNSKRISVSVEGELRGCLRILVTGKQNFRAKKDSERVFWGTELTDEWAARRRGGKVFTAWYGPELWCEASKLYYLAPTQASSGITAREGNKIEFGDWRCKGWRGKCSGGKNYGNDRRKNICLSLVKSLDSTGSGWEEY